MYRKQNVCQWWHRDMWDMVFNTQDAHRLKERKIGVEMITTGNVRALKGRWCGLKVLATTLALEILFCLWCFCYRWRGLIKNHWWEDAIENGTEHMGIVCPLYGNSGRAINQLASASRTNLFPEKWFSFVLIGMRLDAHLQISCWWNLNQSFGSPHCTCQ